jgi:hypothetical protein
MCQNKTALIAMKKCQVKFTDSAENIPIELKEAEKVEKFNTGLPKDTDTEIYRTIIGNTYNWLDSHNDVHLNACFAKSLKENKNIFHLRDHKFETDAEVGEVLHVWEKIGTFKDFGGDSDLMTQALVMNSKIIKDYNEKTFNKYSQNKIKQHSVGMFYGDLKFAADNKTDKEAYALYHSLLPKIGNKEKVEEQGYFYAVVQAKLKEVSAVLLGSNSLTGVLNDNNREDEVKNYLTSLKKGELFTFFDFLQKNYDDKEYFIELCGNIVKTKADSITFVKPTTVKKKKSNYLF